MPSPLLRPACARRMFGPGNTHPDPGRQVDDRLGRQFRLGRHLDRRVMPDGIDQGALFRPARHHDRPAVGSLSTPSRESSRRPDCCFLGPWHENNARSRIGRIRASKNSACSWRNALAMWIASAWTGLIVGRCQRPGQAQSGRPEERVLISCILSLIWPRRSSRSCRRLAIRGLNTRSSRGR